jgi:CheY-like chemotaxis protein
MTATATAPHAGRGALILLVDNHVDTQAMYCEWLEYAGFRVVCCDTADAALAKALEVHPDIVATELALRRVDGRDLCAALRADERTKEIPILVVTAWATPEYIGEARRAGCDAVLVKPVLPEVIEEQILRLLKPASDCLH